MIMVSGGAGPGGLGVGHVRELAAEPGLANGRLADLIGLDRGQVGVEDGCLAGMPPG